MDIRTLSLNIDEQTFKQIEQKAAQQGTDTEQVIAALVQQAMGQLLAAQESQQSKHMPNVQVSDTPQEQSSLSPQPSTTSPAAQIAGSTLDPSPTGSEAEVILSQVRARNQFLSEQSAQVVAQAQAEVDRIVAQVHQVHTPE